MGAREARLRDVRQGEARRRFRLLAPLRYLEISHPTKRLYDFVVPGVFAVMTFLTLIFVTPPIPIFGAGGLLKFVQDLLVMGVPFMVGALAAVAMGNPGPRFDQRPLGVELFLDDQKLSLRQFTCYLLGYLAFLGLVTLVGVVAAELLHHTLVVWLQPYPKLASFVFGTGLAILSTLLASLFVTTLWALYFLTDIVNQGNGTE